MKILEKYLDKIQKSESVGGFAIDSLHTRERTLPDAKRDGIVVVDKKFRKVKSNGKMRNL